MTMLSVDTRLKVRRLVFSFAALHALNAVLNLFYTLIQLIVFARVLAPESYSRVVFLTAIGFYVLPLSQAVGRANFVALRESFVRGAATSKGREVVALLYAQAGLLLIISVVTSFLLGWSTPSTAFAEWLYLVFCLFTNFWFFDLQSTIWALDLGKTFERLSVIGRAINFVGLAAIWLTHDFVFFGLVAVTTTAVSIVALVRIVGRQSADLRPWLSLGELRNLRVVEHLKLLFSSLLSTLSELLILNSPYALLALRFGVGPALVTFDTVMKLARLSMTMSRNLAEIALPRQSRLMVEGDRAGAARLFLMVVGLCILAALAVAGCVVAVGPTIFRLLLGPNDVVPPGAAWVAGAIILASALYQPAAYFLSYNNAQRPIRLLTLCALAGFAAYALALTVLDLDVIGTLSAYAAYFAAAAVCGIVFCWKVLTHDRKPAM